MNFPLFDNKLKLISFLMSFVSLVNYIFALKQNKVAFDLLVNNINE